MGTSDLLNVLGMTGRRPDAGRNDAMGNGT